MFGPIAPTVAPLCHRTSELIGYLVAVRLASEFDVGLSLLNAAAESGAPGSHVQISPST